MPANFGARLLPARTRAPDGVRFSANVTLPREFATKVYEMPTSGALRPS